MSIDQKTIHAIRVLSAEAIDKAKSGHPGICLGSAPIAYNVFQNFLTNDPDDLKWDNRDRFILSAGHGSALLYTLFHLYGYGVKMDDLKEFRQLGSITPGHPEYGHTAGVETTTGPLGQGIATAVGMAVAEAHLAAKFNRKGLNIVDHYTYVLCGDGCLEEGISYEACSFAGTNALGKLILFYDHNDITIEGNTDCTFKEDVAKRFEAQNWQVLKVDLVKKPDDVGALASAVKKAKAKKDKPTIIICKTQIGQFSSLAGSEKCHGSPLGEEKLKELKQNLGWTEEPFTCPDDVYQNTAKAGARSKKKHELWNKTFALYEKKHPDLAKAYLLAMSGELPDLMHDEELFWFDKPLATRQTSSIVLNKLAAKIPTLVGGSADLAPSNLSEMKDTDEKQYGYFSPKTRAGQNIHFGIREHAMAAITNGLQLHGGVRAYCSTFFVFSDYMKHSMRLSALMHLPTTYILTHDSIGVGEDGPTHQPVEQLIMLRSIPNLKVFRPADGKETVAAWISALQGNEPTAIVLTRQALPQYEKSGVKALKGGYVLKDTKGTPDVLLLASGSEVAQCMEAQEILHQKGYKARVVSMPCFEEFEKQTKEYKESVIPSSVKARVCVEAGSPYSWYRYAGETGEIIAMEGFGASAPASKLFEKFGFTAENIVEKALKQLKK